MAGLVVTAAVPTLRVLAPAKVNATLLVGPLRPGDGRHELVSVMQSVSLADVVRLRPRRRDDAETPDAVDRHRDLVRCPGVEGENLALTALEDFRTATAWDAPPLVVEIEKHVPIAAGMAGGSGDAAAVLRLAATAAEVFDDRLLARLAAGLGADVTHGLGPGLAVATGAGEEVVRRGGVLPGAVVVVRSDRRLSTSAVYRRLDELRPGGARSSTELTGWRERIVAALDAPSGAGSGPGSGVRAGVGPGPGPDPDGGRGPDSGPGLDPGLWVNDLGAPALDLEPAIGPALRALEDAGGERTMVCGSGPTVVGWFTDRSAAARAAATLRGIGHDALDLAPVTAAPVTVEAAA